MRVGIEFSGRAADSQTRVVEIMRKVANQGEPCDCAKTRFWAMYADSQLRVLRIELVGLGTLDECPVSPREVFRPAIETSAAYVFLVHQHPSGNVQKCQPDKAMTKTMRKAGQYIGIYVKDSLILGNGNEFASILHKWKILETQGTKLIEPEQETSNAESTTTSE